MVSQLMAQSLFFSSQPLYFLLCFSQSNSEIIVLFHVFLNSILDIRQLVHDFAGFTGGDSQVLPPKLIILSELFHFDTRL